MADANQPFNASAPEILAGLRSLEAELKAARAQLTAIERQGVAGPGRAAAAEGGGRSVGDAERLAALERDYGAGLDAEGAAERQIAALASRKLEIKRQQIDLENQAQAMRTREVLAERDLAAEIDLAAKAQTRLNTLVAVGAKMPAEERAAWIAQQARTPIPINAPGTTERVGVPYSAAQIAGAQSAAFGVDAPQRLDQTRSRVEALARTESEYTASARQAGAMSDGFLQRLATGQATLSEFGGNLAATAGKFAGWTAAATGVGALVGVVTELGRGAQSSASGVAQLQRSVDNVNPERAQAGFRAVSSELNVSVKEVADAQFQMSRTFSNQGDALTAGRVALLAYKLDNVAVADSVRALTAIHNQFGVQASALPGIFDQLDEGQRRFNARVSESLPALTRSSAAVKNAGGDLQGLIPIIEYAIRVSGQSGNVIGNALARSASNFVPKQANQQTLRSLGLDPTEGYTQLLTDAIHKAATLTGQQRQQLARALGGPQLGSRVFAPILGGQGFDQIAKGVSPTRSAGAAVGELHDKLQQTDEQLHQVTNSLQRIGSALAESGAFGGLGVLLQTLNLMLSSVEKIIGAFNQIPASIRPWVVGLLEARGIMAVLQRTRIGAGLADATGIGALGPSATRRAQRIQTQGIGTTAEALGAEAASTQARARAAASTAVQQQRLAESQRQAGYVEEANASENEANILRRRATQLETVAAELKNEERVQRERMVAIARDETLVDRELVAQQAEQMATRSAALATRRDALASPSSIILPAGMRSVEEGATEGAVAQGAAAEAGAAEVVMGSRAAAIRQTAGEVAAAGKRFGQNAAGFVGGMGLMGKAFGAFILGQMFFDSLNKNVDSIAQYRNQITRGSGSVDDIRANLQQARGGHDIGIAGHIYDAWTQYTPAGMIATAIGGGDPFGPSQQEIQDRAAQAQANLDKSILDARRTTATRPVHVGYSYNELIKEEQDNADLFKRGVITRAEFTRRYNDTQKSLKDSIDVLTGSGKGLGAAEAQAQAVYAGALARAKPDPSDPFSQFSHGTLPQNLSFMQAIGAREKIGGTRVTDFDTLARGVTFIQNKYGGRGTWNKQTLDQIDQAYSALDTFISQQADEFKAILDQTKLTGSHIPATAITPGLAVTELQTQTRSSDRAYRTYIASLQRERADLTSHQGALQANIRNEAAQLAKLEARQRDERGRTVNVPQVAGIGSLLGFTGGSPFGLIGRQATQASQDDALTSKINHLREKLNADRKAAAGTANVLAKRDQKILAEIAQAQEEQYTLDSQAIDLRSQYAQATAADQSDAIAQKIRFDGEQVQLALRYHGPDRWAKIMTALITQQQDIASQASQHLQDIQLRSDVATSAIRGSGPQADMARLQSQLRGAERVLSAARAEQPNPGRRDAILNAEKAVNDLQNQIAGQVQQDVQSVHQNAQAVYDSHMAILLAQAGDDPLKKDRLTLQRDQHDLNSLRRSDFKTRAEYIAARNNALATVIGDRHQILTDTANQDLQNAEFEHNIGRLTDDQYISRLKDILRLKGISTQMRQQLLTQIYQAEHANQSNLELNVGNIRMPSIYEVVSSIRRAGAAAGQRAIGDRHTQKSLVNQTNHNTFNFYMNGRDDRAVAKAVGVALDQAVGGAAMANLRAAGVV